MAANRIDGPDQPAYSSVAAWARLAAVALAGFALDMFTKWYAFSHLGGPGRPSRKVIIPRILLFQTTRNHGGVFGIAQGHTLMFIAVSVIALVFVLYVFAASRRRQVVLHLALGLILAGALGNLYDRVFNHGKVRDFILLVPRFWPWVFNVADAMLTVGVPLLMLCWVFERQPRETEAGAAVFADSPAGRAKSSPPGE